MARMPRPQVLMGALLVISGTVGLWQFGGSDRYAETAYEPPSGLSDPAPLCPWREPDADVGRFFIGANRKETVTLILSSRRLELARDLGRQPSGDENALRLYRVFRDQELLGGIMVRRVKGTHGAIEVVLAVTPQGRVSGVRLQRQREPAELASILGGAGFLGRFRGRCKERPWGSREDFGDLPAAAQPSANAIVEGIHSLLVLLAVAEHGNALTQRPPHS